jgi:hypothetical protein
MGLESSPVKDEPGQHGQQSGEGHGAFLVLQRQGEHGGGDHRRQRRVRPDHQQP